MSSAAFFQFSDLLRQSQTQSEQSNAKGKGKAVMVDLATSLLENVSRASKELQYNLTKFEQTIQQIQGYQKIFFEFYFNTFLILFNPFFFSLAAVTDKLVCRAKKSTPFSFFFNTHN